jgi:hypothetical protein
MREKEERALQEQQRQLQQQQGKRTMRLQLMLLSHFTRSAVRRAVAKRFNEIRWIFSSAVVCIRILTV